MRKSLSSPLNRVDNNSGDKVQVLGKFEVLLIASFDSTNQIVEDRLDEDRSGLDSKGKGNRSFRDKVVDRRRSNAGNFSRWR